MIPQSFNVEIIQKISALGHEIGYHYEDMDLASKALKKNESQKLLCDAALESFRRNLEKLRQIVPVETICMHGSPLSRYDNRSLWDEYDYREYGLKAEPYFDLDFSSVLYLSDTGRRWNGDKVSIRDKVNTSGKGEAYAGYDFRSTADIIHAAESGILPDRLMINSHPQRWFDFGCMWTREKVLQSLKNTVKYFLNLVYTHNKKGVRTWHTQIK
jgi:hypothetical protein